MISLKPYNTFSIDVKAETFVEVFSLEELKDAVKRYPENLPLGGGSNLLFLKDVRLPVIKLSLRGISVEEIDEDFVLVKAMAGENWHDFTQFCVENNFGGLENLSLIPGQVGSCPVQNIGAYGVEIKDVMAYCRVVSTKDGEVKTFSNQDCRFGYRESVFKRELKGEFIIFEVAFKLTKRNHRLKTNYGAILSELEKKKIETPSLKDISEAVQTIRKSKLPDPKILPNCGSFFKNPVVSKDIFDNLKKKYPEMPSFYVDETSMKIPAGWLIEASNLKGYRVGNVGVHQHQALVLVNYGGATGQEVFDLAEYIKQTIFKNFGINLEIEVNIL